MSETGSEYSQPPEISNRHVDPTGSLSVREENDLDFGSEEESPRLARKRHGAVLDSQEGANEPDVSKATPSKRPRSDSLNEFLGLEDNSAAKGLENLGSVRLALGCYPVARSQNCALSVHAPSEVSVQHSKQQPVLLTKDHADLFQAALQDAKKESS